METSKQGFVSTPAPGSTVSAQGEDRMLGAQATLPAMYLQSLGGLPRYPPVAHQGQPTGQEAVTLPLSISPLHTKQALPLLTLHIASGMHLQQGQRSVPPTRPKSTGKHVCPHCGRDCLKPSVLEKHLRCHTGERPYPCTICGIAFKTQSNLYKHKRTQAHARLSSESEKVSFSSQESISGTGDASSSSPYLRPRSEDLESFESEVIAPPVTLNTTSSSAQPPAALGKIGSDTGWALHQAALVGLILAPVNGSQEKLSSVVQKAEPSVGLATAPAAKPLKGEGEQKSPAAPKALNRHLLLQRQEATSFSKQWESSTSGRKSQSYDSTDSGFSESNEHHWTPSPTSTVHDQSMESLTESSVEHHEGLGLLEGSTEMAADAAAAGPKSEVSVLEKKKLEERISKLISENETLVDDKRLENVRPRKTVLSKQGSIDLPMPYTYKDSFHFEIKTTKQMSIASSPQSPDMKGKQALYNSVPTQQSNSLDHTPLTRSSSLPFSLCTPGLQRHSQHGQFQKEGVQMARRDSSGQLYTSEFAMKSVDQQSSHHRSLVRQSAVDCLPAGEGLNVTSSMEENYPCSHGSDGDSVDASGESIGGKCRRKKSQKFSYSKWHMYGGGTFTKLYSTEKGSEGSLRAKKAAVSMEQGKVHEIQSRATASLPETVSSVASTVDLGSATTSIQSTFHSQHLPSICDSQIAHGQSNHFSCEPDLRRPSTSDLSTSINQSVVRQYSPLTPDCLNGTKAGLVKGNILREQSMQHNITSQCHNHLPSERKKQRTGEGGGMPVDIINLGEKEHNVLSCMTSKIGSKRPNQSSLALRNSTIPTCTHLTKKADDNKLLVQQIDNKMDLSLSFISQRQHQRSRQTKELDSFASFMTLGGVSASPSVSSPSSRPAAFTKSSFLPKYQLKLPHSSVSEQGHPDMPALQQRLTAIPASEQSLTVISTSEQGITVTPVLEESHPAVPAIDSEQSCTPTPPPTTQKSYPPLPTPMPEHRLPPMPPQTTEKHHVPVPASTLEQSHSPTATHTLRLSTTPMPTPTSEQSHTPIASPTPEMSSFLSPTSSLELSHPPKPTPTLEHSYLPKATREKSHTPIPAPTLEHILPPVPTPTAAKSHTLIPASPLRQSHPLMCTPSLKQGPISSLQPSYTSMVTSTLELSQSQILTPEKSCTPSSAFILGQGHPPIPTYTLRQSNSSLPIASVEWSHTSAPTVTPKLNSTSLSTSAINWSISSTPNPQSTQLTTAASTTSEVCAATHTAAFALDSTAPPITGQIHPASPMIISGQSRHSEGTPATETSGQMYSVSLQHSATSTATPMLSDTASSSPVCSNQDTHFPTLELLPAGQVILLKDASNAAYEETEHLKPGDIQIFLQIISDTQLSLMESQLTGNVQQQMNISQDVPVLSNEVQGCSTSGMAYTNSSHQASSSQSPGPSTPSYWEIFTQAEQHQEYQSSERAAQKSFTPLKSISTPSQDPAARTDISRSDRTPLVPGQKTGGSVLRTTAAQLACVHTEPRMHNHSRPDYSGLTTTARNFECPNQKLFQEESCSSVGGCHKESLPLQRMRADGTHSPVLLYSQAPPSSMATSTATVDRSTYPRLCIPDLCSTLEDTSTKTDKHTVSGTEEKGSLTFPSVAGLQSQQQMSLVGIQMNAVNAAAVPTDNIQCTDPLNTESLKNKLLSANKHHQTPAPSSLHVWDDARCPDGLFSSDSTHCQNATPLSAPSRMERPTSAEPVGGDTSSTSHLSPTSNRLFIHPSSEAVHPTAHSDLNAPTSTYERPSMFQGSVTPSPTVRQWTLDIAKESHQEDIGGDSLPSDLSQQGTVTATHSSLEGPVPTCLLNVTQELLQQELPEQTSPGSVPPVPTAEQQTQYEGYALQASECDRSADPCLQVSHIAPKNSQQEPVSASPPGQYKLCLAASISLSPSASTEISSGSVQVHVSIQHKPFNQTEACNTGKQGAESGISTNEIIANPGETSGRFSMVEPAQLTQVGDVEQSGLGTGGQNTEVSSPSSCQDRKAPLSQDLIVGTGPSIGLTKIQKTQLSLKSSNLLCGLVTGPSEKALSGDALNICPLQSSQMQVTSHQVTHQGLEHSASKGNMATGREDRGSSSFASSPQHDPEESQTDDTQASDAGHLCFSSSPAQQEARTLGSRQRLEEWEDREAEELGCRWEKKKETGEEEATDSGVMENAGFTNPSPSPSVKPHKGPASEEVAMDGLDDNGSLTNAGSTMLPHFPHGSSHRTTTHTLQFHALKETNILHVVQTATRRETCTLQMLQSLTQNKAGATHAGPANRDGQYCPTDQNQLRHYSDVRTSSSDWGMYRGLCPPLSPAQQGHTTEACPLPVVTSQLGSKTAHQAVCHNISWGTSTPPLLPAGSGVQPEAVEEVTQTTANSTAEPSEQPTPASTHSVLSQSSVMSCSPSMSMRSAEVSTRAPPNSLEEVDTSSSDDEGRLVIELE